MAQATKSRVPRVQCEVPKLAGCCTVQLNFFWARTDYSKNTSCCLWVQVRLQQSPDNLQTEQLLCCCTHDRQSNRFCWSRVSLHNCSYWCTVQVQIFWLHDTLTG
jgi:hypothetical protein